MHAPGPRRGGHLTGRRVALSGGRLASLFAPAFARMVDRIDVGLEAGTIEGHLPDGTVRRLGGRRAGPLAVVHLHSWRALLRLGLSGSAGWYRAWELGEWSSPDPVPVFDLFMRNRVTLGNTGRAGGMGRWLVRTGHALRRNSKTQARRNIEYHYDLGNDFYAAWLDTGMTYSSAIFAPGDTLEAAQDRKIAALLDRLAIAPGDRLLEIGCGWGSLAQAAVERGASYHGITLSPEQQHYAERRLTGKDARFSLTDYRDVEGQYDAIASVEMVEAVGQRFWGAYLDTIARVLRPGGRAAIQYIAIADDIFERYAASADFIQTYIFPGGMLLSESRFRALAEARGLTWEAPHHFGQDYAETLRIWRERFDVAAEQGALPSGFDARFVNLWRYYLMYCEGGFRGGGIDVAQVTLVKT